MSRDTLKSTKPEGYPLPWCKEYDVPYWKLNMTFILIIEGWTYFQKDMFMSELIPYIDLTLKECKIVLDKSK